MKILGEKSLSSKVVLGLYGLFIIISFIDVIVLGTLMKVIRNIIIEKYILKNVSELTFFTMLINTGIIALYIIYQFIKIFINLKNNILFSIDNVKRLNIVSNSCFIISSVYLMLATLMFFMLDTLIGEFIHYIFVFSITLMVIFVVSGIGIKILNEIYKKAIEYKEENDFTI